jgi:hypothetical protein
MPDYSPSFYYPDRYWPPDWWPEIGTSTGVAVTNSARWMVVNAIASALIASTGIATVSDKREPWWDFNPTQFPHVFVMETNERKERFSYPSATANDMHARLDLTIEGYAYDNNNDLDTVRMDLIRDIEVAIQNSTAVKDATWEMIPQEVVADTATLDNYCIVHCHYQARYLYNHVAA